MGSRLAAFTLNYELHSLSADVRVLSEEQFTYDIVNLQALVANLLRLIVPSLPSLLKPIKSIQFQLFLSGYNSPTRLKHSIARCIECITLS